jgi:transcription antitermination protein NusB
MTRRSRAREVALQLLFQRDANPDVPRPALERFVRDRLGIPAKVPESSAVPDRLPNPDAEGFCMGLYDGVVRHLAEIDSRLAAASENWKLHRMAASDRNVLRLGTYEIAFAPEPTPGPVALDEAIELARRYGSKDSPAFVNGVLDKVFRVHTEQQTTVPSPEPAVPSPGPTTVETGD